jgi:hypothetical protein
VDESDIVGHDAAAFVSREKAWYKAPSNPIRHAAAGGIRPI